MCFFGEGGALEGEFHESLNFAGLHKLPVVYVIDNNQYCLSTPIKRASAVEDLSSRASALQHAWKTGQWHGCGGCF